MMAKYFATSLAIENVVSEPRVIKSCLPISTISMSLVGLESRSIMLPASRAACLGDGFGDRIDLTHDLGADRRLHRVSGAADRPRRHAEVIQNRIDRALAGPG